MISITPGEMAACDWLRSTFSGPVMDFSFHFLNCFSFLFTPLVPSMTHLWRRGRQSYLSFVTGHMTLDRTILYLYKPDLSRALYHLEAVTLDVEIS